MIHSIRTSKFSKIIASYLAIQLLVTTVQPTKLFALTSGPSQPEFNSFTPIGTSDMVNLSTGDFNYNIPIMDVGGYPLNLAYDSGVTMDQEASWVGLGWNLNVGQINRQVRGIPDDFKGDTIRYEKHLKDHITVGINAGLDAQLFGIEEEDTAKNIPADTTVFGGISLGLGVKYSNYEGISFTPSYGISFDLSNNISVGMDVQTSATEGVTIAPKVNAKANLDEINDMALTGRLNAGLSFNSNRGLSSFNLGSSLNTVQKTGNTKKDGTGHDINTRFFASGSGSISFSNLTLTPRKRSAFQDFNGTFSYSFGADIWGTDGEIELAATISKQKLKTPIKEEKAYGYEFTGQATENDILDYNRENDRIISKNILALPYTNYTYDLYTVNGQGIGGMFRPHRSQIGQIYDEYVKDESTSFNLGVEFEGGTGWHLGANLVTAPSESHTGIWKTRASNTFKNENENTKNVSSNLDYEPVYFKYVGENKVDKESSLYTDKLYGDKAITMALGGAIDPVTGKTGFDRYADKQFQVKNYQLNSNIPQETLSPSFSEKFKRTTRDVRNQSIQKITKEELSRFYEDTDYARERINAHPYAKNHHTVEMRILKPDGSTYVFGETAYNTEKQEVVFATDATDGDCASGLVTYDPNIKKENSAKNNTNTPDQFYDKVVTPAYAHTYLLSSVLSSDYEDLTGNGPTDDDLGAYTLFEYDKPIADKYQWRVPYGKNKASFNAGLNSAKHDQKGSYLYGKKEIKYVKKIITKTHIAIFDISPRKDARGVTDENGMIPSSGQQEMYKINTIRLYSKPEYDGFKKRHQNAEPTLNDIGEIAPIKTAHFIYNYALCQNLDNNLSDILGQMPDDHELVDAITGKLHTGKLTLKKVYFTYRSSLMGKHTPYTFDYDENNLESNPDYSLKAFDIWGNYKPNVGSCDASIISSLTTSEYPFVDQLNKTTQDQRASAWSLRSIGLPSGGSIDLTYESDDYQYVQDKPTMQMFKVVGAGVTENPDNPENNQLLYQGTSEAKYLYVELPEEDPSITTISNEEFQHKYLKDQDDKPIYFRFLMNMTKKAAKGMNNTDFDYVTGYFNLDKERITGPNKIDIVFKNAISNKVYAAIPMVYSKLEGGVRGGSNVNPISKAGWYFARTYLNKIAYGLGDYKTEDPVSIAKKLAKSIGGIGQIFKGPNGKLKSNEILCAQRFIPEKSWIRLSTPKNYKLGGGSRIKELVMNDHWNKLIPGINSQSQGQDYGQTYDYTLEDTSSSGVATFEPNDSAENPFVEPFYDLDERLVAPREVSYIEKPFGKAFFPYSKVTYSRVTVKNLDRDNITRHATGKVISEFYTTKDFPTKVDYTDLNRDGFLTNQREVLKNLLKGLVGIEVKVKNEFTLSQGYVIHTNDMDGKAKSQKIYQEGMDKPISSIEYKYSTLKGNGSKLDNNLVVIDKDGTLSHKEIAVDYDVITDFRESYSKSRTTGVNTNVVTFLIGIFPVIIPTAFPSRSKHENIAHSIITTKVVHTTAILKEKIASDLGSKVSRVNEAWDAQTGQVILTKTINEFDDAYYNFNFPAYWAYNNMGQASRNLGLQGTLRKTGNYFSLKDEAHADDYLTLGDEIMTANGERFWIVEFNTDGTGVLLMNRLGSIIGDSTIQGDIDFKIVRSGYRNQQMGNMASITMMKNPLNGFGDGDKIDTASFTQSTVASSNLRIINASAVAYDDFWNCQCENNLPFVPNANLNADVLADLPISQYPFNPYLYNVKDEWRAKKSYAYLTERTDVKEGTSSDKKNTRKEGYFKQFTPYYASNGSEWELNTNATQDWTFASEVTQYSPYGAELENKDALDRYSSAQYGYNYTLPTVVASNSKYRYMGADNFEDYDNYINTTSGHFTYKDIVDQDGDRGIVVSSKHAHTGNNSLLVTPDISTGATLPVELIGEQPPVTDSDGDGLDDTEDPCPYTHSKDLGNGNVDIYPCYDNSVPKITHVKYSNKNNDPTSNQITYYREQAIFTIQGTPNSVVSYQILELEYGRTGYEFADVNYADPIDGHRFYRAPKHVSSIVLDATGRANVEFQVKARRQNRRPRSKKNRVKVAFQLLDLEGNANENERVVLDPVGCRRHRKCRETGWKILFSD